MQDFWLIFLNRELSNVLFFFFSILTIRCLWQSRLKFDSNIFLFLIQMWSSEQWTDSKDSAPVWEPWIPSLLETSTSDSWTQLRTVAFTGNVTYFLETGLWDVKVLESVEGFRERVSRKLLKQDGGNQKSDGELGDVALVLLWCLTLEMPLRRMTFQKKKKKTNWLEVFLLNFQ